MTRELRFIFSDAATTDLYLTEIIKQQTTDREMVLTVANWNEQKQALVNTYKPSSCTEIPMSLEDIFIECTNPKPTTLTVES